MGCEQPVPEGVQFQVLQFSVSDPEPPVPKGLCPESMLKDLDFYMYDSVWSQSLLGRDCSTQKGARQREAAGWGSLGRIGHLPRYLV